MKLDYTALERVRDWTIAGLPLKRSAIASGVHRGVWLVKSMPLIDDGTAASSFDRLILTWTST